MRVICAPFDRHSTQLNHPYPQLAVALLQRGAHSAHAGARGAALRATVDLPTLSWPDVQAPVSYLLQNQALHPKYA